MAKKTTRVKERESYSVGTGTREITASVDVGVGQIGTVVMTLDDDEITDGEAPLPPEPLGLGNDIIGQLLLVEATVTDVSIMSNKMKVIVRLAGGSSARRIEATAELANEADTALFQIAILFKR